MPSPQLRRVSPFISSNGVNLVEHPAKFSTFGRMLAPRFNRTDVGLCGGSVSVPIGWLSTQRTYLEGVGVGRGRYLRRFPLLAEPPPPSLPPTRPKIETIQEHGALGSNLFEVKNYGVQANKNPMGGCVVYHDVMVEVSLSRRCRG